MQSGYKKSLFLYLFFAIVWLNSCMHQGEKKKTPETGTTTLTTPKVTVFANLPDSGKPKEVVLEKDNAAQTINVPRGKGGSYTVKSKSGDKKIDLLPPSVNILPKERAQGKCNFTTLTTDNGLALDAIICIYRDKTGNMWFGTDGGGVSCYNGKFFTNYTTAQGLANNNVYCITEDKNGNMWFGTDGGGASRYDGREFTNYTTTQGLANNQVMSITEDANGNLWFGTYGGGASRYDGKSFTNYDTKKGLANNNVKCIAEDKNGNIWFGTHGGGISCYNGKSFINYNTAEGLASNSVRSIATDKNGDMWFGTDGGGVSRYDGKNFINYNTEQGLANNTVWSITKDKNGNMWFGTYGGGASCYNESAKNADDIHFTTYTTAQGLASNNILSITEDKSGNLWFGTDGAGASRYDGVSFTNYTTNQGLPNNDVRSITEDRNGNMWFGTNGGGVTCYDGKSFTTYTTAQGLANDNVVSIAKDKNGNLWLGTNGGGVSCYNGKSFTNYTTAQGLAGNNVLNITEDTKGNLWFGTAGAGVSCFNGTSFTNYSTAQGLADNNVVCITEDKNGDMWFGTYGGGASRYNGKSFTNYTSAQGLANDNVLNITEDKSGNLWFATDGGGASRYDEHAKDGSNNCFITYTVVDGLPDNTVTQIQFDAEGNIVMGTNQGIAVLKYFIPPVEMDPTSSAGEAKSMKNAAAQNGFPNDQLKDWAPYFEIYNNTNGYPVKDVNSGQNTIFKDSKGILWIATGSDKTALVRFDPSGLNRNIQPLPVIIQSLKINEENVCWYNLGNYDSTTQSQQEIMTNGKLMPHDKRDSLTKKFRDIKFSDISKFYPIPQNLELPYNHNSVTFDFVAIETGKNFMVRYQYILDGYTKEWSPVTEKTSATFGNIHEGTYTFRLKARSPEGIWSEQPLTYTFKVLPPWYRTWWMYLIYALAVVFVVWQIVLWNVRRLRAKAKELEQEVHKATVEIVKQKDEIEKQKKIVEEKNKDILDSINYAKRLQDAILPPLSTVEKYLPESFILYKPKDIVAGDFYWMERADDKIFIAACDCTGHGVPGALVSMVCSNALNRAVNEFKIRDTGKLLDKTKELVLETFGKSESEVQDGMDVSLCVINPKTYHIEWSGANVPLWYISKGELKEIAPDKQPVGKYEIIKPFTTRSLDLQKGDSLYLFTDGYADQFGGPKGKKFKYKQLQEKLQEMSLLSMKQQKLQLEKIQADWKGALEQVDDLLVIGIRL